MEAMIEEKKPGEGVQTRGTTVRRYASKVFKESSVGLVSSLAHTDSSRRRIYKVLALIACLTGFLYQTGQFLAVFFQYPTSVDIDIVRPELLSMPGFTFCDNNGINRRIFCEKFPEKCKKPDEAFCKKYEYYCDESRSLVPKKEYYPLTYRLSLEEMVDLNVNRTDFVKKIQSSMEFEDVTPPFWRQKGYLYPKLLCYSLHDRVNNGKMPVQVRRSGFINYPKEKLNFEVRSDEVFIPGTRAGIIFAIHSPFEAVNPLESGVFMKTGRSYMVFVSMEEELLQQAPYDTECVNYTEIWIKNGYSGPRLQNMCRDNCLADISLQCLNCIIPNVYYPRKEKLCELEEIVEDKCADNDGEKLIEECRRKCRDDCRRVKYSYKVQERFIKSIDQYGEVEELDNTISVEVFLEEDEVVILKHTPKYMIVEVFSNIGGFIGCWLGVNLLDITDILEGFFRIFRYSFKR